MRTYGTDEFIRKAQKVHGRKYTYKKTNYTKSRAKVIITCSAHGDFHQKANSHLNGQGCPKCAGAVSDTESFIRAAKLVHSEHNYDYSSVVYITSKKKVHIICPEHGGFNQTPNSHLRGSGCPKCASIGKKKPELSEKFTYSTYLGLKSPIEATCKEHPDVVLIREARIFASNSGVLCPRCYQRQRFLDVSEKSRQTHDSLYEYLDLDVETDTLLIRCKDHGEFYQNIYSHISGSGCQKCATRVSKPHKIITDFLESLGVDYLSNTKEIIPPYEVDIYIPSKNIAIEINGVYWHSNLKKPQNYHNTKHETLKNKGVRLVQFWDLEVMNKTHIVLSMVSNLVGKTQKRIFARETVLSKDIRNKEYLEFLDKNHLQGRKFSSRRLGLFHNGELVSVLGLSLRAHDGGYTVDRFATKTNHVIPGGFSKLLKHSGVNGTVHTFSSDRYTTGNVYEKAGFVKSHTSKYSLYYTNYQEIRSRNSFQKHKIKHKVPNGDEKTEEEIALELGWVRLWNVGNTSWVLHMNQVETERD